MGLFGLRKKINKKIEDDNVPIPSLKSKIPEIGEIKRAISEPKQAIQPMQSDMYKKTDQEFQLLQPILINSKIQDIPERTYEESDRSEIARPHIKIREIGEPIESPVISKPKGPIYIKIDNFESALSDFEEIKKRMYESFELLEKVKNIRGREDEELEIWEREVDNIKRRLANIDRDLFSRADY